jgi:L-rhamnose mutarotase
MHKRPYRNLKILRSAFNVTHYGILLTKVTRLTYSYIYVNKMKKKQTNQCHIVRTTKKIVEAEVQSMPLTWVRMTVYSPIA